jgi:plasmid maintenance system killer protein
VLRRHAPSTLFVHKETIALSVRAPHALVGRDKGRYAVNASGNWRITFGWTEGDAIDLDLEDYH